MLLAPRIDIPLNSKSDRSSRLVARESFTSSKILVIIDPDVANAEELAAGVILGAAVRILDPWRDRIIQITEILREYPNLETLHLVSHGSPGCLHLGNSQLNFDTLPKYATEIKNWFSASQTPHLLLYGCNVAQGAAGREFISKLQQLTHAQIQASSTKVGNSELGGNWQLDIAVGGGDSFSSRAIVFNSETKKNYAGIFAAPVANDDPHPLPDSRLIELSELDGSNGFAFSGINADDLLGKSVSDAGDFNGDGLTDIIIGALGARSAPNRDDSVGESYVVFGTNNPSSSIELSNLDGTNGFVLQGIDTNDRSGQSVSSAGDFNNDGLTDIIIGAHNADPNGESSGESYVVFGTSNPSASIELSSLDGSNGFTLKGIAQWDISGFSVSDAGDVNGDGLADIIIGAYLADTNGESSGESYVVFGTSNPSASFELSSLDGTNGFVLRGINGGSKSGFSVSGAGDFNGDGLADIIIGSPPNNSSYVVFGTSNPSASFELSSLDGSNGFRLRGVSLFDESGFSVSGAGDVNGDGLADIIIGAPYADPNGIDRAGESYVVFGTSNPSASFELSSLDGSNGFVLNGISSFGISFFDRSGVSVSDAGDVNGDGLADIIIGAHRANPYFSGTTGGGYVVFGNSNPSALIRAGNLDGSNGFTFRGIAPADRAGRSVSSAGDFNDDGLADLIIGAYTSNANGLTSGEGYVVFSSYFPRNFNTDEDTSFTTSNVLFNDNDPDKDPISIIAIDTTGTLGVVANNSDGTFDYDPNGQFESLNDGESATDTFSYTISDGSLTDTGTVMIAIAGVNDSPIANNDSFNTDEDTAFTTGSAIANDTDPEADSLTITAIDTTGTLGIVTNNGDGTFNYDPNGQFESLNDGESATDTFSYTISDGNLTDTATVTIAIAGLGSLINGSNLDDSLIGGVGKDTIKGFAGNDILDGQNDDDSLIGGNGNDILNGQNDNDSLIGGNGNDTLNGGIGNDILNGQNDNDFLIGGDGNDTLNGGFGNDILEGQGDNDRLVGSDGNDTLIGGVGADFLSGQNDDDSLIGGDGNDTFYGGLGADILEGNNDNDHLISGDGNDTLNGGAGADNLSGQNDDDSLTGGDGNDTLNGGLGNDILDGQNDDDRLVGSNGNDTLIGGAGVDSLWGQNNDDSLLGGDGNDILGGSFGNDILDGQNDNDRLTGGDGNDTLIGGLGLDTLFGQAGSDRFRLESTTTDNRDFIKDFEDGIDLFELAGTLSFGSLTITQTGDNTNIIETATSETLATLTGITATDIDGSDFV